MLHTNRNLVRALVILAALAGSLIYRAAPVTAQTVVPEKPVYIYLFWGDGCPHCAAAKPFFESLPARYPGVIYRPYEVYYDQQNQQFFTEMAEKYGIQQFAVPTFFIGPYYLQGYSDELAPDIEKVIAYCLVTGCVDAAEGLIQAPSPTESSIISLVPTQPAITITPASTAAGITTPAELLDQTSTLEIPLIGSVNLASQPVIISTALIALVDGFNPCSLWVLSMLLALTLHTGSRKKSSRSAWFFLRSLPRYTLSSLRACSASSPSPVTWDGFRRWLPSSPWYSRWST
ncbi:MAG: glutaredoxin family protein [Anaerolineaceae bacterium]